MHTCLGRALIEKEGKKNRNVPLTEVDEIIILLMLFFIVDYVKNCKPVD
jgi:hypothetical protein